MRTVMPASPTPFRNERLETISMGMFLSRILPLARSGTPEWTRTTGLLLRRQTLYPSELQAHTGLLLWCHLTGPDVNSGGENLLA